MKLNEISDDQIIVMAGLGAALVAYGTARGAADTGANLFEGAENILNEAGNIIKTVPKPKNVVLKVIGTQNAKILQGLF